MTEQTAEILNKTEVLNQCILCKSISDEFFIPYTQKDGYHILQCKNCGLIFVNPRDNPEIIVKQYQEDSTSPIHYYQNTAGIDALNFNKRFDWIEEKIGKGRLIDIGCNVGTFLEVAKKRGWTGIGVEANKKACHICRSKNLEVYLGLFDSEFVKNLPQKDFDLVCLNDSIEHFPNPLETLRLIAMILRPGGFVSISTPNIDNILARMFQIKPKEHLFYFTKETLVKTLNQCGYKIELIFETGRRRAIGALHLGASLSKTWLLFSKFLSATKLDYPISLFLEYVFKDELFVLARKI